jgi:ABC-type polysaccharide/polyol phosphate transport system ATPase subunit
MSRRAIEVDAVSKRYRLGEHSARYLTLRESLASLLRRNGAPRAGHELWALRDVTLTVDEGEVLGVIGRNGAGKSTLLKILAHITEPTSGASRTRGRVGSLLEVGTGFHPELTGEENIYLNGAILGMTRADTRRRFDDIVEFAQVERFLDTPLKRYSSGMYLRLAFAVAAHVDPDIVVVDEVLAVGDADFQHKCLGKMSEFGSEGRTVVFVSHDLGAINQLCSRTIWLDRGEVQADGSTHEVVDRYFRSTISGTAQAEFAPEPRQPVQLLSIAVTDERGSLLEAPRRDKPFTFSVRLVVQEKIPGLDFAVYLRNRQGIQILSENWSDAGALPVPARVPQEYEVRLTVPPVLVAGDYVAGVWSGSDVDTFIHRDVLAFRLWPAPEDGEGALERTRLVQAPEVRWQITPVE